jgi:hypothetical protein
MLHRKQKYKQWATKYYTENKKKNNGPQKKTKKTKKQKQKQKTKLNKIK